jgi:hypothetical protein
MIIQINNDWRLDSDSLQFILQHRHEAKNADADARWRNIGYFASLDSAICELARRRIRILPGVYGPDALPLLSCAIDEIKADVAAVLESLRPGVRLTPAAVERMMAVAPAE